MWSQLDSAAVSRHLQASMLLLLLLCFFSSPVSWSEEPRLFSSFSTLAVCWVTSASSCLGSGLGVSGSGVWKLQLAQQVALWLYSKKTLLLLGQGPRTSYTVSTHTHTHTNLFSVVVFVGELVRSCSLASSSSKGWRFTISTRWGSGARSRITTLWLSHSWNTHTLT